MLSLIKGDAINVLATFADNSFDAIITDPPTAPTQDEWILPYYEEFKRIVKPGGLIAFCQPTQYIKYFPDEIVEVWVRDDKAFFWVVNQGQNCRAFVSDNVTNGLHPTSLPFDEVKNMVDRVVDGGSVLDPFMGSGTIGKECLDQNKDFTGIDIEQQFVDMTTNLLE